MLKKKISKIFYFFFKCNIFPKPFEGDFVRVEVRADDGGREPGSDRVLRRRHLGLVLLILRDRPQLLREHVPGFVIHFHQHRPLLTFR